MQATLLPHRPPSEPFLHVYQIRPAITQAVIEGAHTLIRPVDVQIDLGTSGSGQPFLKFADERFSDAARTEGRMHRQMVYPSAPAVEAAEDGTCDNTLRVCDKEEFWITRPGTFQFPFRIGETGVNAGEPPQPYDRTEISRTVLPDAETAASHGLPARSSARSHEQCSGTGIYEHCPQLVIHGGRQTTAKLRCKRAGKASV